MTYQHPKLKVFSVARRVVREQYWLAKLRKWKRCVSGFGEPGLLLEGRA